MSKGNGSYKSRSLIITKIKPFFVYGYNLILQIY